MRGVHRSRHAAKNELLIYIRAPHLCGLLTATTDDRAYANGDAKLARQLEAERWEMGRFQPPTETRTWRCDMNGAMRHCSGDRQRRYVWESACMCHTGNCMCVSRKSYLLSLLGTSEFAQLSSLNGRSRAGISIVVNRDFNGRRCVGVIVGVCPAQRATEK